MLEEKQLLNNAELDGVIGGSCNNCNGALYVRITKCIGCGACVELCPFEAVTLNEVAEIDPTICNGCEACKSSCPVGAIE